MKPIKIWILKRKADFASYTSDRFNEVARNMDIELKLVAPEEIFKYTLVRLEGIAR
jgi:hypothetical protein